MTSRLAAVALCLIAVSGAAMAEKQPDKSGQEEALTALLTLPAGRTYSDQEVRAALANSPRGSSWYDHIDEPFRQQLLRQSPDRWLAVIICNFQGAMPGTDTATQCEDNYIARQNRAASQWDEHGNWVGASDACLKANVRTQYGELVCESVPQKPPGS